MADIFFDGPAPPAGRQWCAACLMLAKQGAVQANQDAVRAAAMAGDDAPAVRIRVDIGRTTELAPAVTTAISTIAPQFGPMLVCWSHAIGIELTPQGVSLASPQEAAMINQAVQLGNRKDRR